MAPKDSDSSGDGPSLELPSLGFGRKRRRADPDPQPRAEPEPTPESEPPAEAPDEPTGVTPAEPAAREEPTATLPTTAPAPSAPPAPSPTATRTAGHEDLTDPYSEANTAADDDDQLVPAGGARRSRTPGLPALGGQSAAAVTGLLVGLAMIGLIWGSMRLCEVVRGTSSCGNPGFFLILASLAVMVVLGAALLRGFGVRDAGSTSFLGVGVLAVVVLLFLSGVLFEWWVALVIPALSVAAFWLAHWVSTAFVEPSGPELRR